MRRWRVSLGAVAVAGLAVSGCSDSPWAWTMEKPETAGAAAAAGPAPPPEAVTEEVGPADARRQETIDQVLRFVDRIPDGEAVAGEGQADAAGAREPGVPPGDPSRSVARANMAFDVNEVGGPGSGPQGTRRAGPQAPESASLPVVESVFVQAPGAGGRTSESGRPTSTTNSPLSAADQSPRNLSVAELATALERQLGEHPRDLAARWQLGMLRLALGEHDAARELASTAAGDEADVLGKLMDTIVATRGALENPVSGADGAFTAAKELYVTLEERSDLQIPEVAFCTRVQTFGVYDEMPGDALRAHRPNRVIVYIELANFASQQEANGRYRTELAGELEVLTQGGQRVWRHEEPDIVDESRQRRQDFFLAQMVTLPPTLSEGEYVLKVSIQDALSGKSTQALHPFTIHGQQSGHASRY